MRTITGTYTSVQCFDEEAWKQERLIINFNGAAYEKDYVRLWTSASGSSSDPLATYALDANHKCKIDVTDYIRTYLPVSGTIYVGQIIDDGSGVVETITIPFTIKGLINPANVYHPSPGMPFCEVLPPERILWNPSNFGGSVISECYINDFFSSWAVDGGSWVDSTTKRQIQASGDFTITWQNVSRKSTFYGFFDNPCDDADAVVRWLSFSGVQRKHYFKVRKSTITPQGAYQLLTMDNSYNEIKGREDSVTLVIDELSAYDLWYYADIITSSKVELLLRDVDGWSQVQVTNKNVTIPDGDARNGKLEITVNWRRYDAVTM